MHRVVLATLAAGALAGCGGSTATLRGSGHVVSESRQVPSFDRIDLKGSAELRVTVGARRAVTVRADDNIVPHVHTDVVDGVLVVSEKGSYTTHDGVVVDVSLPALAGATLAGAGSFVANGISSQTFDLVLDGAGSFDLAGTAGRLDATLNGVGSAGLEHLRAAAVQVVVNGTGSARVYATDSLDATVRGVGSIVYLGDPATVHTTVTGLGSIAKS